jgi:hypothetical protein
MAYTRNPGFAKSCGYLTLSAGGAERVARSAG